jgi:two-component system sensor histidine kinase KdpD
LNRLVGNLLDLSRIEAGSIRPEKGWYDLGSLVNEVAGRLGRLATSHNLVLDVPDDLPPTQFDYVEIDQVLTNLIENAVNYTPAGCEIRVSVRMVDNTVRIEVADNGPGIRRRCCRTLQPFYRAAVRPARRAAGWAGRGEGSGRSTAVRYGGEPDEGGAIRVHFTPRSGWRRRPDGR